MAEYRISEVAERTGFRASTLRFYEEAGLIPPAGRCSNGYRKYDDRDLERLRLIARAKWLGLSLDEITGLVELLDLNECAPVQERLRELLVAKRRDLAEQIAELESLCSELARVADRLGLPASAGACDDSCACFADEAARVAEMQTVPLGSASATEVPIGCSLDAAARPERLAAWQELMAHVVERVDVADGVRLRFGAGVSAAEVADLAAKEEGCCSFFRFKVGIADGETTLDIAAPPEASEVVEALLFRS